MAETEAVFVTVRRCFAPMEGITGPTYRRLHRKYYPGLDRYYLPFLSPTGEHRFTGRSLAQLDREHPEVPAVPQLLTKSAPDFLWAARQLADLGFSEVNLNLGCPSGTVVSKQKGAGMLGNLEALEAFLDEIFRDPPLAVSVKTRIGLRDPEEWPALLALFCRYPLAELTVHPRTRTEFYKGSVHDDAFQLAYETCPFPLCCNGNLFSLEDVKAAAQRWPRLSGIMAGRGLLADPGLFTGKRDRAVLIAFHEELAQTYRQGWGTSVALAKMKELWAFLVLGFAENGQLEKAIHKARTWEELLSPARELLHNGELLEHIRL